MENLPQQCWRRTILQNSRQSEENGWFDDSATPAGNSFHTVPTLYTDSPALAPYLHSTRFTGEGTMEEDGLHIRFYEV